MTDNNYPLDDANEEMSFEEMLESSLDKTDDFIEGDKISGTVISISSDTVFVDINGKSEAVIAIEEFYDKDGKIEIQTGDSIEAYIVSTKGGEIQLTTNLGKGQINAGIVETAYENAIPISGTISAVVKGGYSVTISGIRCFCPFSQIDFKSPEEPESLINKSFEFKIIQYENNGRNIVLSRRALLEESKLAAEQKLKESLKEQDVVSGEITQIRDFGIFINLDGLDALVPKSEISWSRRGNLSAFTVGQKITAAVKQLDWDNKKITLSIKDTQPDPWSNIGSYQTGQSLNGRVVNIIKSGAFVEIEPGMEGYIPISRMSVTKKINKVEDILKIGDVINYKINTIDAKEKRISLELLTDEVDPWLNTDQGLLNSEQSGTIESSSNAGINVRLKNGMLGFAPRKELLAQSNSDIQKEYEVGKEIKTVVIELDGTKKRVILSERAAIKQEELKDYKKFQKENTPESGSTLGAMFKDTFKNIQDKIKK